VVKNSRWKRLRLAKRKITCPKTQMLVNKVRCYQSSRELNTRASK